jgi:hypothetical protein
MAKCPGPRHFTASGLFRAVPGGVASRRRQRTAGGRPSTSENGDGPANACSGSPSTGSAGSMTRTGTGTRPSSEGAVTTPR